MPQPISCSFFGTDISWKVIMSWNRAKAVDYFIREYSRYDPSQYVFRPNAKELEGVFDTELALQKLYMECAAASEEKETLLSRLNHLARHGAEDPRAHNTREYKSMIQLEAAELIKQIETGKLDF